VIGYRHTDPRLPFLWESADQPAARWHEQGSGPVQYLSSTPDAAWAEFLRHEEITDAVDLLGVERSLWAIDLGDERLARPRLPNETLIGGTASYAACRREAARLRATGARGLVAPSAAVDAASGSGFRTARGLRRGRRQAEHTIVLFGPRPDLVAWAACDVGRPRRDLLPRVRRLRTRG
jgi:hypothetical protein